MTIKTTTWKLDSCGCILSYTWDDSVADTSRVNTFSEYSTRCASHSALSGTNLYNACLEENQRKNNALVTCLDNGPTTLYNTTGEGARVLKPTVTYSYTWSGTAPNRVLTIQFSVSLNNSQKTTIRNALNTRFGTGKVSLV